MFAQATVLQPASLRKELLDAQNPDGSWGFQGKSSWTEPTALALLALSVGGPSSACERASRWLIDSQRPDGGWAPHPAVDVSTWLTSLVALSLFQQPWDGSSRNRALQWLRRERVQPPAGLLARTIAFLNGQPIPDQKLSGMSWYPGTAAWVYPTAVAVLTFLHAESLTGDKELGDLARQGQQYILSRRCSDGGWNHGGSRYLNEEPVSYPEMTGLALLALGGVSGTELATALQTAQRLASQPASGEGLSWLQMGLAKHGLYVSNPAVNFPCRNPREIALRLLALFAGDARNFLVSPHSV